MKWVWMVVFLLVAIFGYGVTPWDAVRALLENQGISDEDAQLIAFVAGFTLPLTVGSGVCVYLFLQGTFRSWHPVGVGFAVAGILFGSGGVAAQLGLGLLPSYANNLPDAGGHPVARLLGWVVQGYFNTYGWPLMVCSLAIGVACALQVHAWLIPAQTTAIVGSPDIL